MQFQCGKIGNYMTQEKS